MIQRLYAHNFRCLENFELKTRTMPSALLIGGNGSGKSTIALALEILQRIARRNNRVGELVQPKDFTRARSDVPIRFEIEALIDDKLYQYIVAFDLPRRFRELRVAEEQLIVSGEPVYAREEAQVTLFTDSQRIKTQFSIDWHLVALPIIQIQSEQDPLGRFRTWLARTMILAPIPAWMTGDAGEETLEPKRDGSNFGDWFSGLLSHYPAAYTQVRDFLQEVIPDVKDFLYESRARDFKTMIVRFAEDKAKLDVYFEDLSDGEKCFFLCAAVLAANDLYGPLFCFWDEPDNYLSLSEIGYLVTSLRRCFGNGGQILVASHNAETIRSFSDENTLILSRKSHLEPTVVRLLGDVSPSTDLVDALTRGDVLYESQ